jgi:hypothetical protein
MGPFPHIDPALTWSEKVLVFSIVLAAVVFAALCVAFWPRGEPPRDAYHRAYCLSPMDPNLHGMPGYVRPFEPCSWRRKETST